MVGFDGEHRFDNVVHQGDVPAQHLDLAHQVRVVRRQVGIDVERGDLVATLDEFAQDAIADESSSAEDEKLHGVCCTPPRAALSLTASWPADGWAERAQFARLRRQSCCSFWIGLRRRRWRFRRYTRPDWSSVRLMARPVCVEAGAGGRGACTGAAGRTYWMACARWGAVGQNLEHGADRP